MIAEQLFLPRRGTVLLTTRCTATCAAMGRRPPKRIDAVTRSAPESSKRKMRMSLRTVMQAGPAKANELFAKLLDTSEGAVKTREKLFPELKIELELHASLEEQHLFPILRRNAETKGLIADAIKDNKELRAKLAELDGLPKNDATFAERL